MLRPSTASRAGRNVVASSTAVSTTSSPPTPTDRVSDSGVHTSAAKPTTTVIPDVITADPAVSIERREAGHLDVEAVGAGRPRQGVLDLVAQVRDDALVDVAREFRRQRRDQERGAPVLADEAGFADRADRDHLADVWPALGGRLQ